MVWILEIQMKQEPKGWFLNGINHSNPSETGTTYKLTGQNPYMKLSNNS